MRQNLLILLFALAVHSLMAQQSLRIQNSFFLTGQPIFGLGYAFEGDDRFTFGIHLELGEYMSHHHDLQTVERPSYSLQGIALMPEARFFIRQPDEEACTAHGVFIAGYGHLRRMNEYAESISEPLAQRRVGHSIGAGAGIGYRTACGPLPLYFEAFGGYGKAVALWQQPLTQTDARLRAGSFDGATTLYRLELAVGYTFRTGKTARAPRQQNAA
jgi:hypothetical protein